MTDKDNVAMPLSPQPSSHVSKSPADMLRASARKLLSAIPFGSYLMRRLLAFGFKDSRSYWEARYAKGDNSGAGSYGDFAEFKGRVLQDFMRENNIRTVIDFGCGDGNQVGYLTGVSYTGLDVSATAIDLCRTKYKEDSSKHFVHFAPGKNFADLSVEKADISMSLDVIFHLVEDEVFSAYIENLFTAANRFVVIYSSNIDKLTESPHVRHRNVTGHVERFMSGWSLYRHVENPHKGDLSDSDFFIYSRNDLDAG
jgi:SAM-dependent methyltransferase